MKNNILQDTSWKVVTPPSGLITWCPMMVPTVVMQPTACSVVKHHLTIISRKYYFNFIDSNQYAFITQPVLSQQKLNVITHH